MRWRVLMVATSAAAALGAALLAAVLSSTASADPGRRGKVVRVERPKAIATEQVQICGLDSSESGPEESPRLMCFGAAPRVGADIDFVDESGYRGSGRVLRSEPGLAMFSRCKENAGNTVYFEWTSGDVAGAGGYNANVAGVFGMKLSPTGARLVNNPDRRPPEGVSSAFAIGLDADGDASADLVMLVRECRDSQSASGAGTTSQYQPVFCVDYWLYERSEWKLVNQAVVFNCF